MSATLAGTTTATSTTAAPRTPLRFPFSLFSQPCHLCRNQNHKHTNKGPDISRPFSDFYRKKCTILSRKMDQRLAIGRVFVRYIVYGRKMNDTSEIESGTHWVAHVATTFAKVDRHGARILLDTRTFPPNSLQTINSDTSSVMKIIP